MLTVAKEGGRLTNDPLIATQGETIAEALIQQGYSAQKLDHQLAWSVCQTDEDWWMLLTFELRPTAQWRLLPAAYDETQSKLYSIIQQTIDCNFYAKGGRQRNEG